MVPVVISSPKTSPRTASLPLDIAVVSPSKPASHSAEKDRKNTVRPRRPGDTGPAHAERIAPQAGKLAGLIFLAANARHVEVMALEQNEYVASLNSNPSPEMRKHLADLRAELGPAMAENEARGLDFRPPGGESPREVQARLKPFLADLAAPTVAVPLPPRFLQRAEARS